MKRALLALLALAGCKEPRTELIIGIATDLRATDNLDSVHLQLLVEDVPFHEETWSITGSPSAPFNLPGSFGIYRDGEHDRVQIKLVGSKNGTTLVTREATLGFIDGKTSFYRMGLTSSCMASTCPAGQTCVEGECKGRDLDSSMFPSFEGALVTELTCKQPGTPNYIDTATGTAMPLSSDAAACPGNLCAEGTCLVPPSGKKTFKGVFTVFVIDLIVDGNKLEVKIVGKDPESGTLLPITCDPGSVDGTSFSAVCRDTDGIPGTVSGQIEGNVARGMVLGTEGDDTPQPFTAIAGADVLRYCGTFDGDQSGIWSFVTGGGLLAGTFFAGLAGGELNGTVSGSNVQIQWNAGTSGNGTANGTVSDDKARVTGNYQGTVSGSPISGTFTNDQASCADR